MRLKSMRNWPLRLKLLRKRKLPPLRRQSLPQLPRHWLQASRRHLGPLDSGIIVQR